MTALIATWGRVATPWLGRGATASLGLTTALLMLFGGCATAPQQPQIESLTAQQIVADMDGFKFGVHGSPTDTLASRMRRLQRKCEAPMAGGGVDAPAAGMPGGYGGEFEAAFTALVFKDRRGGYTTFSTTLHDFMACVRDGRLLWGATMAVDKPESLNSSITSGMDFYGVIRLRYLDADEAQAERTARLTQQQQREAELARCRADEATRRERLRRDPRVGDQTTWGLVIEARAPLARVQFNEAERRRRGVVDAWVQAGGLDLVSQCF